eukprot:GHVL01028781.1.p1 GENE.GHVL01028781.1~~GHVL01028781.1.p1  ORF type:complete len:290 (-),score=89.18 GHVL01028781.1:130-999(-)
MLKYFKKNIYNLNKIQLKNYSDLPVIHEGERNIYFVGLLNNRLVGEMSTDEACEVIDKLKPTQVLIELCDSRYEKIRKKIAEGVPFGRAARGKILYCIHGGFMMREYKDIIIKSLLINSEIHLIDRPIDISIKRVLMNIYHPIGIFSLINYAAYSNVYNKICKKSDILDIENDLKNLNIYLHNTLINERSEYMKNEILLKSCKKGNILIICSPFHLEKIMKNYKNKNNDVDIINIIKCKMNIINSFLLLFSVNGIILYIFLYLFYISIIEIINFFKIFFEKKGDPKLMI